jgi:indole-3-acetate monooxygenase
MPEELTVEAIDATETPLRSPERDELLAAVGALTDLLRHNARAAEEQRTLPVECVEAMREARLFSIAAPRAVGGLEVDPLTQIEIIEATTRIDTSAGWTLMIGSHGTQVIGAFASEVACERVFGASRWPIAGSQISPGGGVFDRVEGGYRVTGRWSFASGIRHCDWSMFTATERNASGESQPATQIAAAVPVGDLTVHDNWLVAGLQGTGSCDYLLEDTFIPDEMAWPYPPTQLRGGPRYRLKLPQATLAAFALGAAARSLQEIISQAKTKYRPASITSVAARPHFHHKLGEAEMRLRAARAGLFDLVAELWESARSGVPVSAEQEALLGASPAYSFEVARSVTTIALQFGGSGATYLDNALQRNFRDVAVGAQHFQASEQSYEVLGKALLRLNGTS